MLTYMKSTHEVIPVRQALQEGWKGDELVYHGAKNDRQISLTGMGNRSLGQKDAIVGIGPPWDFLGYGFSLAFPPDGRCVTTREWTIARRDPNRPLPAGESSEVEHQISVAHPDLTTPSIQRSRGEDPVA